ncbi:asparagine synthase-related protein [Salinimicrobium sp. TIG7-5_MAKvit]|uniref:asparagine synthase-related protein n=1 Tax=Salinimicrobium sp. TIG7-5_MAKvit TaxID=3121289 RepID=UPI003C6DC2CE
MSKLIYIVHRHENKDKSPENKLYNLAKNISPKNISSKDPIIYNNAKLSYVLINPTNTIKYKDGNVLLGAFFKTEDWTNFNSSGFDGNYALFRVNSSKMEILTDVLATRTVWYFQDSRLFIAATSQRAIIQYLGEFKFNESVIPWMISSGSLGPKLSWDSRIKKIPADAVLSLDRKEWKIRIKKTPVKFKASTAPKKELKIKLKAKLEKVFTNLPLDFSKWVTSLSGGYDSRAILNLLIHTGHKKEQIKTVTWGVPEFLSKKNSDASVAQELANALKIDHTFFNTEGHSEAKDIHAIFTLFLKNGEGRNDHIPSYMDGFKIWKTLYDNEVQGVIRGDEVFGYNKIYSEAIVKDFTGITKCSDFSNLQKYPYIKSIEQKLPEEFLRQKNESLDTWKDRIFHLYRIPIIQSSLADLKYCYIEQINPFLSRDIVYQVRELPDNLRRDKKLFREIVQPLGPQIPYSSPSHSQLSFKDILRRADIVSEIQRELNSSNAQIIFPQDFLNAVMENMKTSQKKVNNSTSWKTRLKDLMPVSIKKMLAQKNLTLELDENVLAFRLYIVCRMHRILEQDSKILSQKENN